MADFKNEEVQGVSEVRDAIQINKNHILSSKSNSFEATVQGQAPIPMTYDAFGDKNLENRREYKFARNFINDGPDR